MNQQATSSRIIKLFENFKVAIKKRRTYSGKLNMYACFTIKANESAVCLLLITFEVFLQTLFPTHFFSCHVILGGRGNYPIPFSKTSFNIT